MPAARPAAALLLLIGACPPVAPVRAQGPPAPRFLTHDFDAAEDPVTLWRADEPAGATVRGTGRQPTDGAAAPGCAEAAWDIAGAEATLRFVRPVPAAAAIEDLELSLQIRTKHRAAACLRVVFPNAVDPETGGPATAWVLGDVLDAVVRGEIAWRPASVAASRRNVDDARRRVRFALRQPDGPADLTGAFVDRAGVVLWAARGAAHVRCDDVRLGPLVPAAGRTALEETTAEADAAPRAVVRGGRMTVDGAPFFPRLTYHKGTDPAVLRAAGFNLIQAADWRDGATLRALDAAGLHVAVTPPEAGVHGAGPADINAPAEAGLAPFTAATDPVVVWHLHPRLPNRPGVPDAVRKWVADVRAADHARRRPVLFGVTEREAEYSRTADLLAVSRFVCGTSLPLWEQTALMRETVGRKVRPGEPVFTWVQTGPHDRTRRAREAAGLPAAVLEPELIERQVWAAVGAGVKGLGYNLDASQTLTDATPADRETRLSATLANTWLEAVEPILAGATKCEPVRVIARTDGSTEDAARVRGRSGGGGAFRSGAFGTGGFGDAGGGFGGGGFGGGGNFGGVGGFGAGGGPGGFSGTFGNTAFGGAAATGPAEARPRGVCEGALLHRGVDRLVVAVWQGEHDQFVPGPAPFTGCEVTIPGALPTAAAWVVTPVGLSNVPHDFVAGGMRVSLPEFTGVAVVLVTPDHAAADALRRRVAGAAGRAAGAAVELAQSKLERTKITGAALRGNVPNVALLDAYLRSADGHLAKAARAARTEDYDVAYAEAERCKRFCRAVQRAHWDRLAEPAALAAGPGTHPEASAAQPTAGPHLVSFSTLPDHLQLVRRLGEGRGAGVRTASLMDGGDALPPGPDRTTGARTVTRRRRDGADAAGGDAAGGYDEPQQWVAAPPGVQAGATFDPDGTVRLAAQLRTGAGKPDLVPRGLVTVFTPPVRVPADRAAVVRGEVSVEGPISGEGVTIHDSRGGAVAALRWTGREAPLKGGRWAPFSFVRPFPAPDDSPEGVRPEEFVVSLQLHGLGGAKFRGLEVDVIDLDPADRVAEVPDLPPAPAPAPRLLDRFTAPFRR